MISALLLAFILYFMILATIALVVYHKNKKAQDFMLGGRSMNYFVTAIAAQASDMSSWLFLAFPAAVYLNGVFEFWTAIGLVIFMFLNWTFVAPAIRKATQQYNSLTLSSYLAARYNDRSGIISISTALLSLFFFTIYIASGLLGIGRLFEGAFELSLPSSMFIGVITALIYTLVGGFLAVAWCNVFKGLFMLFIIVLVPLYAWLMLPVDASISAAALQHHVSLSLFPADKSVFQSLFLICGWGLGYFGQPHILIYFMGIDDAKNIKYAKYIGMIWMILALTAAGAIGLLALASFNTPLAIPETLFITMAKGLFSPFMAGVALCGIFAATLATLNNHILIAGSVIAEDIYKRFGYTHASNTRIIGASRLGSVSVCIAALILVYMIPTVTIYQLVQYAWSGLGSSFGPVLLASLYSTHVSHRGAVISIIAGGLTAAAWPLTSIALIPLIPGFAIGTCILIVDAYLLPKKL